MGRIMKPFANLTIVVRKLKEAGRQGVRRERTMGQKVNPIGLRSGHQPDLGLALVCGQGTTTASCCTRTRKIREELSEALKQAAVSKIVIERPHKKCRVTIQSARPGRRDRQEGRRHREAAQDGGEADRQRRRHQHRRDPQAGARRAAGRRVDRAAARAPRRVPPRHEARRAVGDAARRGRHPHQLLGPLGGAEIAAWSGIAKGRVPLHTCAPDVDFGVATAFTTYGTCGVKVWIFKGEILEHDPMAQDKKMAEGEAGRPRRDAA
jgi:small subunit ribosomal protein S3